MVYTLNLFKAQIRWHNTISWLHNDHQRTDPIIAFTFRFAVPWEANPSNLIWSRDDSLLITWRGLARSQTGARRARGTRRMRCLMAGVREVIENNSGVKSFLCMYMRYVHNKYLQGRSDSQGFIVAYCKNLWCEHEIPFGLIGNSVAGA